MADKFGKRHQYVVKKIEQLIDNLKEFKGEHKLPLKFKESRGLKNTMQISYNKLAELTGFTYRTVRNRLFELKPIGKGLTGKLEWESKEALPLLYPQNGKAVTDKEPGNKKIDLNTEKARLAKAQANLQELKLAEIQKELIPASEVTETWSRIVIAAKTKFLALPDRLSQILETVSTANDRRKIIEDEIKKILTDLADNGIAEDKL